MSYSNRSILYWKKRFTILLISIWTLRTKKIWSSQRRLYSTRKKNWAPLWRNIYNLIERYFIWNSFILLIYPIFSFFVNENKLYDRLGFENCWVKKKFSICFQRPSLIFIHECCIRMSESIDRNSKSLNIKDANNWKKYIDTKMRKKKKYG